jgi:peroxiredoxin
VAALADDGGARHLSVGLPLPDILLASTRGEAVSPARLGGLHVLYIYPWTGRPGVPNPPNWDDILGAHGSTPQGEGFRDRHGDFSAAGIGVWGISGQETCEQREFSDRLGLPFALLSDAGFALQQALALPVFETGGVRYLKRLTILARDGHVARVIYPVQDPAGHAAAVLAELRA